MAHLQLQLISGSTAGQSDACKFTSLGGTIGRSSACDWTLNDTDRYISNKHIAINFQHNEFILTDTSSNGVFINDAEAPLGKGNTYVLRPNDKLSLGKFSMKVVDIVSNDSVSSPAPSGGEQSDLLGLVTGKSPAPAPASAASNSIFNTSSPDKNKPLFDSKHSQTTASLTPDTPASGDNLGLFDILSGSADQTPDTQPAANPFSQTSDNFSSSSLHSDQNPVHKAQNPTDSSVQSNFSSNTGFSPTSNTIPEDWDLNSLDLDDNTSEPEQARSRQNTADTNLFGDDAATPTQSANNTPIPDFLSGSAQQNLIPDDDIMGGPTAPDTASMQVAMQEPSMAPQPPVEQTPAPVPQPPPQAMQTEVTTTPVPLSSNSHSNMPASEGDAFFESLYEKLGLPKEYIASVDKNKFADELVEILMTSTQGIMSLLAGRSVFKQESRLNMTMIKPQSNNPIKFSLDPSDTLEMLLVKKKPGYMTAKAAYSEALNDIQLHQMAFLSGLQATLSGILGELNPDDIEQSVTKKGKSLMGLKAGTQKWEAFKEQQDVLSKRVNENLNEILSTHFSDAYEAQINSLKNK